MIFADIVQPITEAVECYFASKTRKNNYVQDTVLQLGLGDMEKIRYDDSFGQISSYWENTLGLTLS